jgi:hypothetical protein
MTVNSFPIITKLHGIESVYRLLSDRIRSPDTIRMWYSRGQMPAWAVLALMEICEQKGIDYSASDFHIHRNYRTRAGASSAARNTQTTTESERRA